MTPINEVARAYAGMGDFDKQTVVYTYLINLLDTKDDKLKVMLDNGNIVLFQGYEYRTDSVGFSFLLELLHKEGL